MSPAEQYALSCFTDQIAESAERPCACGKSPQGAMQEIVGKPLIIRCHDGFVMRCKLQCQKCHETHGYVSNLRMTKELMTS